MLLVSHVDGIVGGVVVGVDCVRCHLPLCRQGEYGSGVGEELCTWLGFGAWPRVLRVLLKSKACFVMVEVNKKPGAGS